VVTKQPELYNPDPNVASPLLLLMKWTFPATYVERFKAEAIHGAPAQTRFLFSSTVESGSEIRGKVEAFGGPVDLFVTPNEGLTLVDLQDLEANSPLKQYFLDDQPAGTTGLARRLNPDKYYIAARWNFNQYSREFLRTHKVKVSNPKNTNSKPEEAQPVDWGPSVHTGRVASLSPGLMAKLGLDTDDEAVITIPKSQASP